MIQFALAFFGLVAVWMAMSISARARFWAPWIGLAGQPFWFAFALEVKAAGVDARGLLVLVGCFTVVYVRGAWLQLRQRPRKAVGLTPPAQLRAAATKVLHRPEELEVDPPGGLCAVYTPDGSPLLDMMGDDRQALRAAAARRCGVKWHVLWEKGYRVRRYNP